MNLHHVLLFLERGEMLAASTNPSRPDRLAWIGVYPLDPADQRDSEMLKRDGVLTSPTTPRPICWVRFFEVERTHIEQDVWLHEPDLLEKRFVYTFGPEDLFATLKEMFGLDWEALERPFKSNYPL